MATGLNSAGEMLQLFRSGAVHTRRELQQVTGLARSTVTFRIDALLRAGYLVEDGVTDPSRGRPANRLKVNDASSTVLAVDLGATHGRLAVCTGAGEVLAESVIESEIASGPPQVLGTVVRILDRLLDASGRDRSSLRGVGVGVPGPVEWATGRIARSISMPGWDHYPVADHLATLYEVPVVVDNDANVLGLGEQRVRYPRAHLLLFVKVGTGIGASILLDGALVRGSHAAEGDIGHAKIVGVDELCSCGAQGCLAATASGRAMVRDLSALGLAVNTSRDVVALVRRGQPDAVRVVAQAGQAIGDVLSTVVSLLNPEVVVIGGDVALAHEQFLTGIQHTLRSRTQPLATAHLEVTHSRLGDRAGVTGAAAMVQDKIFSADAVDAALGKIDKNELWSTDTSCELDPPCA